MLHPRGSVPLLLLIPLLAVGCFRTTAPANRSLALSGRVELVGQTTDSTSHVTGTVVLDAVDGVPVELRSGSRVVARTTTVAGAWRITGLPTGSYTARIAAYPFATPQTAMLTLADRDVVAHDTLRVASTGDLALVPNPMVTATAIYFDVPDTQRVTVTVLDLSGRRMRVVCDGELLPGLRAFAWTGVDSIGKPVTGHLYWVAYAAADGLRGRLLFR